MGSKTVVIGLGNPLLSDDSVGIVVSRRIANLGSAADVTEVYHGGIRLFEAMSGYERAIVVDGYKSADSVAGNIYQMTVDQLGNSMNCISVHDMDLRTAIELGRISGMEVPKEVHIVGIGVRDVDTFSEELTPSVAEAVPKAVELVVNLISNRLATGQEGI